MLLFHKKACILQSTIERTVRGEVSENTFTNMKLRAESLQALDAMNIRKPTPIQAQSLPALLDGRDVIGQARTGSPHQDVVVTAMSSRAVRP
jgi:superfamily II DNA/RNA helicase